MKNAESNKKGYQTPRLTEYGDIRVITKTNDNSGAADGPVGGSMDKT
jgi:hypothetical protein